MDLLPDDMLSNILGRLPPCSLAASRCVRKRWCAVIDGRRLLRADLLPLRLDGFFLISEFASCATSFFARPSTGRRISGCRLTDFVPDPEFRADAVEDYCNGLLLLWKRVANPATRQWVDLPPFPKLSGRFEVFRSRFFLAYHPFVSPQHFEVVLIPSVPHIRFSIQFEESEWPPSTLTAYVFSSTKWIWEERSFVREGKPAGTIADMRYDWDDWCRRGVYVRGALHVHCQNDSVMRISLCDDKYQMIKSPAETETNNLFHTTYLGKSEKGVYFALLSQRYTVWRPEDEYAWPWFRVWFLKEEPCSQMVRVLKTDTRLQAMVVDNFHIQRYGTPWIINYKERGYVVEEAWFQDESEWDFDSGTVLHEDENKVATDYSNLELLGFHPWKEIAFFSQSLRVLSYHMNSSKVQEYGSICERADWSFPYTACWMRELLSEKN